MSTASDNPTPPAPRRPYLRRDKLPPEYATDWLRRSHDVMDALGELQEYVYRILTEALADVHAMKRAQYAQAANSKLGHSSLTCCSIGWSTMARPSS